jgi:hypothetical protein
MPYNMPPQSSYTKEELKTTKQYQQNKIKEEGPAKAFY